MVSGMESTERDLEDIEQARLAPYVASADDPMWLWPVIGLMVFVAVASWAVEPQWVPAVVMVAYCVGLGALLGFAAKRRGVQPSTRIDRMPAPLRRELYLFWLISVVGVGAVLLVQLAAGWIVAGIVAGTSFALLGAWYQKRYQRRVAELVGPPS